MTFKLKKMISSVNEITVLQAADSDLEIAGPLKVMRLFVKYFLRGGSC